MILNLETLDSIEAPSMSTEEVIIVALGVGCAGVIAGMVVGMIILT